MLQFNEQAIHVGGKADDKIDAIRKVGQLLIEAGNIEPGYVDSLLAREKVANTYLGNGIAIPHGVPKDRDLIKETGVAVYQVPDGVEWNSGETVFLVVGIAARSDEHLEILTNLTHILDDVEEVARLASTNNPNEIAMRLSGATQKPKPDQTDARQDFDKSIEVTISGPHGLHARPATALVDLAKKYDAKIRIRKDDESADAKSLISLLKLGVGSGTTIRVMAEGPDADEALAAIESAIDKGLEDEDDAATEAEITTAAVSGKRLQFEGRSTPGISASPGLSLGPIRQFHRGKIVVEATAKDPAEELKKLKRAIETAKRELDDLFQEVWKKSGPAKAGIFKAHAEFLVDPEMLEDAKNQIRNGRSAGAAWQRTYEERADILATMKDSILSGRAVDLRDVGRRVLRMLAKTVEEGPEMPDHPVILVADDLTPSDTAKLDPECVLGVCIARGGPTSHTAIIARSLDIPAVVSAGDSILNLEDGTPAILDGYGGVLVTHPTENDTRTAQQAQIDFQARREAERRNCYNPAIMTDGTRIEVVANISDVEEAAAAVGAGGEGIGLMRTEFMFTQRDNEPTEDEQYQNFARMIEALNGLPLTVRTLDIGGDKEVPYLSMPAEMNPFLGERGIRLCLARKDMFITQLRAIFRAAKNGPIRIMYPMIATLEELREAKEITEKVRQEIGTETVPVGMMVEIPSAVMMADEFAKEVDFFSIGTNDLAQYALAMDRLHPQLAKKADGIHPAVLRMIDKTVKAAQKAGIWVGACGGVAGDPAGVVVLTGLGVHELSVSIPSIAAVKAQIRGISHETTKDLAERALACETAADVRALV